MMTSFDLFFVNFHFVRPLWFLALFALIFVLWLLKKHRFHQSPWHQFLPAHLSKVLIEGANQPSSSNKRLTTALLKPLLIGSLSIIALAGPTWQKLPQPVYQTERGSVLIMDMSYSMYATDIKPNRLTRSRFKAIDLLNKINEGDIGMIAYAGDAFIISPLTQDIKNIELLLPSLTPDIMPVPGANPFAALTLAHKMLLNAGHLNGDIYWFTDDVENDEISDIYAWSSEFGHQLNILGIGTASGAPIKLLSGELLKDNSGAIVVPRLPSQKLNSLALRGNGHYQTIRNDDNDIDYLVSQKRALNKEKNSSNQRASQQTGDQWQEQGAWLLLLMLPLLLSYFRRGGSVLLISFSYLPLLLSLSLLSISPTSLAAETNGPTSTAQLPSNPLPTTQAPITQDKAQVSNSSTYKQAWLNLWQTQDQQAQQQYNQDNYQGAAAQFKDSQWQGSSHYKAGNYQAALDAFKQGKQANSANSLYNQGNALAQLQQYDQAITAYEDALQKNPDLQDAHDNIEKIKQQQKEQEQQQGEPSKDQQSQDGQPQDKQKNKDNKQKEQQNEDQQSQNQQSDQKQQSDDAEQNDANGEPQNENAQAKNEPAAEPQSSKENKEEAAEQEKQAQKSAEQAEQQNEQGEEKTAAQIAAEQQAKETSQKHQKLLNKVTDDPYLLLRNKMQIEYQKRRQDGVTQGVKKKW